MRALDGKVALVIGGTRGIGAAISRRMAADGASLAVIYLSRSADAESFGRELRGGGADVYLVQADVSDQTALIDAIGEIISHFGRLDVLVNVAGMAIVGPLDSYADDAFDRIFALNVRAPFLASKTASSAMRAGGRIITIGSIVADRMPGEGGTLYAASKAALGGMTRGLARDLGARGITANLVQPGPIDTERNPADGPMRLPIAHHSQLAATAQPTKLQAWLPILPLRRPASSPEQPIISMAAGAHDGGVALRFSAPEDECPPFGVSK